MSKQSKKKARKRRAKKNRLTWAVICAECGRVDDFSAGSLLNRVADALNECADAGMNVRLRHDVVMAAGDVGGGFVLPLKDGRWTARTQSYDPFVQVSGLTDMDD